MSLSLFGGTCCAEAETNIQHNLATMKRIFEDKVRLVIHQTRKGTGITENNISGYRMFHYDQDVLS